MRVRFAEPGVPLHQAGEAPQDAQIRTLFPVCADAGMVVIAVGGRSVGSAAVSSGKDIVIDAPQTHCQMRHQVRFQRARQERGRIRIAAGLHFQNRIGVSRLLQKIGAELNASGEVSGGGGKPSASPGQLEIGVETEQEPAAEPPVEFPEKRDEAGRRRIVADRLGHALRAEVVAQDFRVVPQGEAIALEAVVDSRLTGRTDRCKIGIRRSVGCVERFHRSIPARKKARIASVRNADSQGGRIAVG